PRSRAHLLLQRLRQALRALAQRLERAALRVDRAVGIALAERAFRLAHRLAGAAELIELALPGLTRHGETALLPLLQQFLGLLLQLALTLLELAERILARRLPWLSALTAALTALLLALAERAIAQLLLLADHVAELIERRHHVVVGVHVAARPRHLQVLEHLLQFVEQAPRRVLRSRARHALHAIEHALEVLRAQHARIAIART